VAAGKITPVKNQGSTCAGGWAFSATASVESAKLIFSNTNFNLSEKQLLDCAGVTVNNGCSGGYVNNALSYMLHTGISTYQRYPSNYSSGCHSVLNSFQIRNYSNTGSTCAGLTAVLTSQPVSVGVDATNWAAYQTGIFSDCGTNSNHAALLVGQTDDYWTIKNSWGTSWGESGYIRLAPGDTCGVCDNAWYPTV